MSSSQSAAESGSGGDAVEPRVQANRAKHDG